LHQDPALLWLGFPDEFSRDLLDALLARGATAFIAEDDALGDRVLTLANERGLVCPDDFSLAVLGDPLSMLAPKYSWTTFTIPRREMGSEAVRLLATMLDETQNHPGPYRLSLPCTFVPGETTGPPDRRVLETTGIP